jgi:hypothetical protein
MQLNRERIRGNDTSMVSGNLYGTDLPLREPDQTCEQCGVQGTVGRAARFHDDGSILEIHRFCRACWPEQSARYRARWMEEDRLAHERFFRSPRHGGFASPSCAFEAATWHGALDVLHQLQMQMIPHSPPSPNTLAAIAAQWKTFAAEIDEPMPLEIEMFVREYGADAG